MKCPSGLELVEPQDVESSSGRDRTFSGAEPGALSGAVMATDRRRVSPTLDAFPDMAIDPHQATSSEAAALVELLTVGDVARTLGVGDRYVYRLVNERRIPYLKLGHYLRFDPEEVSDWLSQARRAPTVRR